MTTGSKQLYEFGPFQIDVAERRLLRDGDPQHLTPKVFDILLMLAENTGHVLSKDEIIQVVWPDTVVEENNLTQNISVLRKILGEGLYIETVPRCGYRFVPPVARRWEELPESVPPEVAPYRAAVAQEQAAARPVPVQAVQASPMVVPVPATAGWRGLRRAPASLRGVLAGATAVFLLALALAVFEPFRFFQPASPAASVPLVRILPPTQGKYVAVLPFQVLGGPASLGYAADGLRGAVAARLLRANGIRVLPFAVLEAGGKDASLEEVARRSGADLVVQGTVQGTPDQMRVGISIEDMTKNRPLWTSVYSGNSGDLPGIEHQVYSGLETALALTPESSGPETAGVTSAEIAGARDRQMRTARGIHRHRGVVAARMTPQTRDRARHQPARAVEVKKPEAGPAAAPPISGGHWSWARNELKATTAWIPAVWHKIERKKPVSSSGGLQ